MHFNVILTGSTGNLGAYLLDELLSLPQIGHVVCLNRADDAEEKQREAHRDRGLAELPSSTRVRFIAVDITDERLGLSEKNYTELANTTDVFIHNAWPVDFNRNIRSFKPFVEGINAIVEFCKSPTQSNSTLEPIKLLFVSSIGATSNWGGAAPTSRSQVPEAELTDWKVARTGYGQSKLLAERLLCCAVTNYNLPIAIIRVGQLCGPVQHGVKGRWPEREWIPSVIKSSIALGLLPTTLGPTETVDWVPADIAARIIIEVVMPFVKDKLPEVSKRSRKQGSKAHFFHLVNPQTSQWADLVPGMLQRMGDIKLVPFVQWVDSLKFSVEYDGGYHQVNEGRNPAGKLVDFFDNLQDRAVRFPRSRVAQLETTQTAQVSATLRQLHPVTGDWMDLWMQQWSGNEDSIMDKEAASRGESQSTS